MINIEGQEIDSLFRIPCKECGKHLYLDYSFLQDMMTPHTHHRTGELSRKYYITCPWCRHYIRIYDVKTIGPPGHKYKHFYWNFGIKGIEYPEEYWKEEIQKVEEEKRRIQENKKKD